MRYASTRPDGTEVWEDALYAQRAYYFNNEVHGMHYGEFANYTEYFARAILENLPNSPDLEEGIDTFCVMEAVRRSALSRQPVAVDGVRDEVGVQAMGNLESA
jgi:predicted dehydrogenase